MTEKKHVLLIEDDVLSQTQLKRILEASEYVVKIARSGEQALQKLKSKVNYQFILININLPGLNGFEVARLVREYKKYCTVPVIAITTINIPAITTACKRNGFDTVLIQPVSEQLLLSAIKYFIEEKYNEQKITSELTKKNRCYFILDNENVYLSYQQARCLYGLLRGDTNAKIAEKIGLTHGTVRFYFKAIKMKFNCITTKQLKEKMMSSNFIKVVNMSDIYK